MENPELLATVGLDYSTVALRNPAPLEDGRIDCEMEHPTYGWIPFTADANDPEEAARVVHQRLST